jgi:hypothetical protein
MKNCRFRSVPEAAFFYDKRPLAAILHFLPRAATGLLLA